MDYTSALNRLYTFLSEQSSLKKISSAEDLIQIDESVISLLHTQNGILYYLPDDILFKKGISFLNDDWVDFESIAKEQKLIKERIKSNEPLVNRPRTRKHSTIRSSFDLLDSLNKKNIIKSGFWDIFTNVKEIKLDDDILILKKTPGTSEFEELTVIKGPMNERICKLPDFFESIKKITEFSYQTTPNTIPPREEHLLSYRHLQKANNLKWDMNQVRTYLRSIWNEKTPSTTISRIDLLFESSVLLVEKSDVFNKFLQVDKEQKTLVGIPSNFIIGVCGGYARGEFSDSSDLDMLLIHEGNDKQFLQVGEALNQVLQHVPNLELCKFENLLNLNFHENSIPNILQAFLNGDETLLNPIQREELNKMFISIEALRKTSVSLEERKNGISKYCWSIYKSIVNMAPIYEKPIGKGQFLRNEITRLTKSRIHEIIPILLRVTESLKGDNNILRENLEICQPFLYDSVFKSYSVITSLQDISTILAVLIGNNFTSSTIDRFKIAAERKLITEEQGRKLIEGYSCFSEIKYKLSKEMPIDALGIINEELKTTIREVYDHILQNIEPEASVKNTTKIAYPLLVFSDLHWGLNVKLAKMCLTEAKNVCEKHQVRSIIIAGDVFNVDRFNEMYQHFLESDSKGNVLLNELKQIQDSLGDQRIHILSGNHDTEEFYNIFQNKILQELDIHFIGKSYKDENIWVSHGDLDFWKNYNPPLEEYIPKFRLENDLENQKIVVGHTHRIYEEKELGFYGNGSIGKLFSFVLVKNDSIELIKSPIEYKIDFNKISVEFTDIVNADLLIDEYIQDNFDLIEWNKVTDDIEISSTGQKRTWIVTEKGTPIGLIPFNKVADVSKLHNIQVYEVAFPLDYTFKIGQKLKEAWGVFSVTGAPLLPVKDNDNEIVGTLSIFSIPKPQKEHTETKEAEIDENMKNVGDFLVQRLLEKQEKNND